MSDSVILSRSSWLTLCCTAGKFAHPDDLADVGLCKEIAKSITEKLTMKQPDLAGFRMYQHLPAQLSRVHDSRCGLA